MIKAGNYVRVRLKKIPKDILKQGATIEERLEIMQLLVDNQIYVNLPLSCYVFEPNHSYGDLVPLVKVKFNKKNRYYYMDAIINFNSYDHESSREAAEARLQEMVNLFNE